MWRDLALLIPGHGLQKPRRERGGSWAALSAKGLWFTAQHPEGDPSRAGCGLQALLAELLVAEGAAAIPPISHSFQTCSRAFRGVTSKAEWWLLSSGSEPSVKRS